MVPGLYNCFDNWGKKGAVWLMGDTHFGDRDIKSGFTKRPTDEELITNINNKVGKHDTFILLGDVGDISCVRKLKGYKILILGNHDTGRSYYERKIITEKFDKEKYQKDEALLEMKRLYPHCKYEIDEGYGFQSPFEYWSVSADNCLFDEVYEGVLTIGPKLILSHEPLEGIEWALNLHGHNHSGPIYKDKFHYNVCADVIGYTPIHLTQLIKSGPLAQIPSVHRITIDKATKRAKARKKGKKK